MKKDFYIYKCLREIHSINQVLILERKKFGLLLILNTPGSLEHFMVHTNPLMLQSIFDSLLHHVMQFNENGSIEFGYKLGKDDWLNFYVKEPGTPGPGRFSLDEVTKAESDLVAGITEIISGLGGEIRIERPQGSSRTFWFTIDIRPPEPAKAKEPDEGIFIKSPDWSSRVILVVDDVYNNRLLLEGYLKQTRARIISVDNGLKAVNTVKKDNSIECVLMDVRMPVLDGYEATRRIKRIKPCLPVVAISAYPDSEEFDKWKRAGCDAYLGKPITINDLTSTINTLFKNVPA